MTLYTATCGRGNEGAIGEWSGYPACLARLQSIASPAQYKCYQLTHTPWLPVVDWTLTSAKSHGLVHFAERQNLVSVCVPSNLDCTIPVKWEAKCVQAFMHACVCVSHSLACDFNKCVITTSCNTYLLFFAGVDVNGVWHDFLCALHFECILWSRHCS
jgi:hypothetical protein